MKKDHTPEYMKQLSGKILEINFKSKSLKMSFLATEDICHSNGTIIQGGFTTVMMDSCMSCLVMELTDFIYTPMSIDINVSFLAAGNPGVLECQSKIVKLGDIIVFESTVYPGLTENLCIPKIEKNSLLKNGQDFLIDYFFQFLEYTN